MLKIRLKRQGRTKVPHYFIVVAEDSWRRDGKYKEKLGSYHPLLLKDNPGRIILNVERAQYWQSVGAQPTETVARLLKTYLSQVS